MNELFIGNHGYSKTFLSNLPPFKGGWVGVPLFFVLSGFLIGGQLWKELTSKNNILFWRFILRRGFRIWPLYYFILAAVYILSATNTFEPSSLLSNAFFIGNYFKDNGPISGSWSLATEEQFYILAPLLLIVVNKYKPSVELSFYRKILFMLFFIPIISRFLTWEYLLGMKAYDVNVYMKHIYRPFHTNSEGLIAGLIISNFYQDKKSIFHKEFKYFNLIIIMCSLVFIMSFASKVVFNFTGVTLGFSALLVYFLKTNKGKAVDFFSSDLLYIISKTSFSIYLIHFYVIKYFLSPNILKNLSFGFRGIEIVIASFLVLGISIGISIFLYILVEKPFMQLREKMIVGSSRS